MNKIAVLGLTAAFALSANAGLIHYYTHVSGDITQDTMGSANGTLVGNASLSNGALATDGTDGGLSGGVPTQGMQLDESAVENISTFSLSIWFQCQNNSGNQDYIFALSDGTTANRVIARPGNGSANFNYAGLSTASVDGTDATVYAEGFSNDEGGQWLDFGLIHLTVTYDGTTFILYVNGNPYQTANISGLELSNLTTICVAGGSPAAAADDSINGTTYAFGIFNSALEAGEVNELYSLGTDASPSELRSMFPNLSLRPALHIMK